MEILIIFYGCLLLIGVVGNGMLAISVWYGRGSRSPLLICLIAADFSVCCISGPVTAAFYAQTERTSVFICATKILQVCKLDDSRRFASLAKPCCHFCDHVIVYV